VSERSLEQELCDDARSERRLFVREILIALAIAGVVIARALAI